ncbi:hypothetical protein C3747_76g208 [Trypanosoma cruzi]|uniref:NIPSNAP domain-containing protein n=2 Tax=Trypanosoma cruzi TaxID=5693 RepID=Q4DKY3_TRYCC|nr:hypothetical protein, conserved [Trypanosoma cruzi]EAN93175.1 hypothetical protein, conserved [Trypanosoma cruzi]PWV09663.1 hypothetical protein C3747_76g208 [Trypanosoma cruzi]RNC37360.1 putative protein NipSnap 3A-like [Trypanosoma cruzi]|eukprot:XP_815026.1 hypothetical protein [Trypanosoma cruzi strain CL Brener]
MLQRSFSLLSMAKQKVYELRVYDIIPNKYDTFYRMSMELLPLRTAVSRCQGYWVVQIGGLNQMVHLWEYDSLQHRYQIRNKIDRDTDWTRRYTYPRQECLSSQTNMLMRMTYREGNVSTNSFKYMMKITPEKELVLTTPGVTLAASYLVTIGEHEGKYFHLLKGMMLDDLLQVESIPGSVSKIMGPARWSSSMGCIWR